MASTIFFIVLLGILCGFQTIDARQMGVSKYNRQRRNYATPEDLIALGGNVYSMQKSIDKINDVINGLEHKLLENLAEKQKPVNDLIEKMQEANRKLDRLQRSQEEFESYGNKLTALEFTLNHVLSKVVYLSENIPARGETQIDMQNPNGVNTKANTEIEILARLNDLLRHVQSIKRNSCGRITLPAAAGLNPLASVGGSPIEKRMKSSTSINSNCPTFAAMNVTLIAEELFKLIARGMETDTFGSFQQLPLIAKRQSEQLEDILQFVKQTDKRLEHLANEDTEQQIWQRMLQYCQDVSNEFSSFAGSSDAIMKRIDFFLRDLAPRIGSVPYKRKNSTAACAGRRTNIDVLDETFTERVRTNDSSAGQGFDDDKVYIAASDKTGCHELTDSWNSDGVYRFDDPDLNNARRDFNTRYCAFATDERAWTVIQRRGPYEIQENFNRSWNEYRDGFGYLNKDFWFGNEFIHLLTSNNNYELLIELENFDGGKMSISYGSFSLDREINNYSLFIGDYKGPGPDSLSYHSFMDFSTYDHSNRNAEDICCTCAIGYGSGWWFDNCLESNLNGIYRSEPLNHSYVGIIWQHWLGDYSLKASRMLIRPKNWTLPTDGNEDNVKWLEDS